MTDNAIIDRLCAAIRADRFDWRKYRDPKPYHGRNICTQPLFCSYGQIGYTVYFPLSDLPDIVYDWEMETLTVGGKEWEA